ncbi:hypothetical protein BUALT_Bualt05G0084500 [Buddleja alternifolia]|uniref:Uncharacterized protein n=1 Tax=Buddleja alternifolia TaxID=168488 RepID=A0AAV6XQS2_9LAMI|nr:hypothetical protein BUALT_Bualt05G0084500 [Buddleja alternifolia]
MNGGNLSLSLSGASSAGGGVVAGSTSTADDENEHESALALANLNVNLISIQDQALHVLKSDLMAKLNKEVKSLDQDSWMFDGPRSRINLISGPGGLRHRRIEISTRRDMAPQK